MVTPPAFTAEVISVRMTLSTLSRGVNRRPPKARNMAHPWNMLLCLDSRKHIVEHRERSTTTTLTKHIERSHCGNTSTVFYFLEDQNDSRTHLIFPIVFERLQPRTRKNTVREACMSQKGWCYSTRGRSMLVSTIMRGVQLRLESWFRSRHQGRTPT